MPRRGIVKFMSKAERRLFMLDHRMPRTRDAEGTVLTWGRSAWAEFNIIRKRLAGSGLSPAEISERAEQQVMDRIDRKEFLVVTGRIQNPETTAKEVPAVKPPQAKVVGTVDELAARRDQWIDDPMVWFHWVVTNLEQPQVDLSDCPHMGAYTIYKTAIENSGFRCQIIRDFLVKSRRSAVENDGSSDEDEVDVQLDDLLRGIDVRGGSEDAEEESAVSP